MFVSKRYILQDQIGYGGMGEVYRALDRITGEIVALKQLKSLYSQDSDQTVIESRFPARLSIMNEFRLLASVRHPHIIEVKNYGFSQDGIPFFTMMLLDNPQTIVDAITDHSLDKQTLILLQLLEALAYLHRQNILHRDLKPDNILVVDNHVYVLDFGLSMLSNESRVSAGTISYMASETLTMAQTLPQSDLYAVGVILYESLLGYRPFPSDDLYAMLYQRPDFTDLEDHPFNTIVQRLLLKDPYDRYPSAIAVSHAIADAIQIPKVDSDIPYRDSNLHNAKFIGRTQELNILMSAVETLEQSQGGLYFIGGEAGVGKSRLVDEVRIRALTAGISVLRGQVAQDDGSSYQEWCDILPELLLEKQANEQDVRILYEIMPNIGQLLDVEVEPLSHISRKELAFGLTDIILDLLRDQSQPTLIILEDIHWADYSIDILLQLQIHLPFFPIMIVCTYRDDEMPHLMDHFFEANHIKLGRFTPDSIAELNQYMTGIQEDHINDFLYQQTDGNALFLVEMLRELAIELGGFNNLSLTTLPDVVLINGIDELLYRRISRIPEEQHPPLQVASLIGRAIDLEILTNIFPNLDMNQWLYACNDAAIIEPYGNQWRFKHDKIRDAIRERIDSDQVPNFYLKIARTFETLYGEMPSVTPQLMFYWRQAGHTERETYYAVSASSYLFKQSRFDDLEAIVSETLPKIRHLDLDEISRKRRELSVLVNYTGFLLYHQPEKALIEYDKALDMAKKTENVTLQARIKSGMGLIYFRQGDFDQARKILNEALILTEQSKNMHDLALIHNHLGNTYSLQMDYEQSIYHFQQALTVLDERREQQTIARILGNIGYSLTLVGRFQEAIEHGEKSLKLAISVRHYLQQSYSHSMIGLAYAFMNQWNKVDQHYRQALELATKMRDNFALALSLGGHGYSYLLRGDLDKAFDICSEAHRLATINNRLDIQATWAGYIICVVT